MTGQSSLGQPNNGGQAPTVSSHRQQWAPYRSAKSLKSASQLNEALFFTSSSFMRGFCGFPTGPFLLMKMSVQKIYE
jgi:hypothetical protein